MAHTIPVFVCDVGAVRCGDGVGVGWMIGA